MGRNALAALLILVLTEKWSPDTIGSIEKWCNCHEEALNILSRSVRLKERETSDRNLLREKKRMR